MRTYKYGPGQGWIISRRNNLHRNKIQSPNSWTKSRHKSSGFSFMLFTVTSTALPWDFYFFKLTQPLTVQLGYTVKKQGRKPDRKSFPLSYSFRNPYRNLKSENSPDYAQKPQHNCTFMNLASGINLANTCLCFLLPYIVANDWQCHRLTAFFISN